MPARSRRCCRPKKRRHQEEEAQHDQQDGHQAHSSGLTPRSAIKLRTHSPPRITTPITSSVSPANSSMVRLTRPSIPTVPASPVPRLTPSPGRCDRATARAGAAPRPPPAPPSGTLRVEGIQQRCASGATAGASRTSTPPRRPMPGSASASATRRTAPSSSRRCCASGAGRWRSMVGAGGLAADRMSRRLGFARVAAAQLALLDDDVRDRCGGLRARDQRGPARPAARRPARVRPAPRAPDALDVTDVLAFAGLQSFALGANWDMELARLKILAEDGPDALLRAGPCLPRRSPADVPVAAAAGPARAAGGRSRRLRLRGAVAGRRRTTGPSPARGPPPAFRCWPTTRTSPHGCLRPGTWRICAAPSGRSPAPRSSAAPRCRSRTTAMPPGASPPA